MENAAAASELVQRVIAHVDQLTEHPQSGVRVPELGRLRLRLRYRQRVQPPCRVFYRHEGQRVFIVHVMRTERLLRKARLAWARPSNL